MLHQVPTHFIAGGGLRADYLITPAGDVQVRQPGGNALYAAVGAALWTTPVTVWARRGRNFPDDWLHILSRTGLDLSGIVPLDIDADHRTFFAYQPDGRRVDTDPAVHFARAGAPMPPELAGYVHSTPRQDDPVAFEPLALRPDDWPSEVDPAATAVHLSPLALATHRSVSAFLHAAGVRQLTVDPGERFMIPARRDFVREILPRVDAFLPSDMEVRSLFGAEMDLWEAAAVLCDWGAPLVVVKNGANGVLLRRQHGRQSHVPAYHAPGDPRVVDVTGAGDSFCGGFMAGLALHGDPLLAARMGVVSASLVVEGYGAAYALDRGPAVARARLKELMAL